MLILLIILIAFLILLYERFFSYTCLDGFQAELLLDQPRSSRYDKFDVILTLKNSGWIILPVIRVHLIYSDSLQCNDQDRIRTSLLFHQMSRRRISFSGKVRGIHPIRAEIEVNDFFGLTKKSLTLEPVSIIIHPEIKEMDLPDAVSGTEGDFLVQRWIFPDPIFFTGNRPYTGYEALKEIDWKASARMGTLRVKQHDTTASFNAVFCLLCENNENLYAENSRYLEEAILLCASLIHQAASSQSPVGLITNAVIKTEFGSVFRPDNGLNHIIRCYDTLSCMAPYKQKDSTYLFRQIYDFMTTGSHCVIIANQINDEIYNGLIALGQKGIQSILFLYEWDNQISAPFGTTVLPFLKEKA